MSEPVPPVILTPEYVPEKLQKILNILQEYKTNVVFPITIRSQDPYITDRKVRNITKNIGDTLIDNIKNGSEIKGDLKNDEEFMKVVKEIHDIMVPWTSEISTMVPVYISIMFIEYPSTFTAEHAKRLHDEANEFKTKSSIDAEPL